MFNQTKSNKNILCWTIQEAVGSNNTTNHLNAIIDEIKDYTGRTMIRPQQVGKNFLLH
jgi:hypothetical protein